jgi:hypothetical protein
VSLARRNYIRPHDRRRRPAPRRKVIKARLVAKRLYRIHREPNPFDLSLGGQRALHELATYRYRDYWVEVVAECGHHLHRHWLWPPAHCYGDNSNRGGRHVRCEKCVPAPIRSPQEDSQ